MAGLEWAASIPGTVGGAVIGNAGAWGGDVASALVCATVLEPSGETIVWPLERFKYGYRSSVLKQPAGRGLRQEVVLEAEFQLHGADQEELEATVAGITAQRKASQPAGATCGSVFKNPGGGYAGRLIEAAGLKGKRQGGAEISQHHANFIVNFGQASADDIYGLIQLARETVEKRYGIALELEIERIGEW
jgi:UDP-N-acetylmuramate dehydrogenase